MEYIVLTRLMTTIRWEVVRARTGNAVYDCRQSPWPAGSQFFRANGHFSSPLPLSPNQRKPKIDQQPVSHNRCSSTIHLLLQGFPHTCWPIHGSTMSPRTVARLYLGTSNPSTIFPGSPSRNLTKYSTIMCLRRLQKCCPFCRSIFKARPLWTLDDLTVFLLKYRRPVVRSLFPNEIW